MGFLDSTIANLINIKHELGLKSCYDQFDITGVLNDTTLITNRLEYMTVFSVSGCIGDVSTKSIVTMSDVLAKAITEVVKSGLGLVKIFYDKNCLDMPDYLNDGISSMRNRSQVNGLDMDDVFDETVEINAQGAHRSTIYLCVYTKYSSAQDATNPYDVSDYLRGGQQSHLCTSQLSRHNANVDIVKLAVSQSLLAEIMDSYKFLQDLYNSLNGSSGAKLLDLRTPTSSKKTEVNNSRVQDFNLINSSADFSFRNIKSLFLTSDIRASVSADSLARQILDQEIIETDNDSVVIGDRCYYPLGMVSFGRNYKTFRRLVRDSGDISFRFSVLFSQSQVDSNFIEDVFRGLLKDLSDNKRRTNSESAYADLSDRCAFSMNFAIYTKRKSFIDPATKQEVVSLDDLLADVKKFKALLGSWSEVSVMSGRGDSLEQVLATFQGVVGRHVVETSLAPISRVLRVCPISVPAKLWNYGSMIYKTDDNEIFYERQMDTTKMASEIITIVGGQGYAKSSIAAMRNLNFALAPNPTTGKLPYLRVIDFGLSISGSMLQLKDSLPLHRRHECQYIEISNLPEFSINFFDLPVGNRYPTSSHRESCVQFVGMLTQSLSGYASHSDLCSLVVSHLFHYFADEPNNPNVKMYSKVSRDIDEYAVAHGLTFAGKSWYEVSDTLSLRGEWYLASIAMRYAVPTVPDLMAVASTDYIRSQFKDTYNGSDVVTLFIRAIKGACESIRLIREPSQLDASQAPVFGVDAQNLIVESQDEDTKHRNAIYFALLSRLLVRDFFSNELELGEYNHAFEDYHRERLNQIALLPKRFSAEELNRLHGIPSAEKFGELLAFHARKYNVSAVFSSQLPDAIPAPVIKLATVRIFCGGLSEDSIVGSGKFQGISAVDVKTIISLPKPNPRRGASYFIQFKYGEAAHLDDSAGIGYKLSLKLGSRSLWIIASYREDRKAFTALSQIIGIRRARDALAKFYPSGTIRPRIEELQKAIDDKTYSSETGNLVQDIVADVLRRSGFAISL